MSDDAIDIAELSRQMVGGAMKQKPADPTPAAPAKRLVPRTIAFRVEVDSPDTGEPLAFKLISTVCKDNEEQAIANLAVDLAGGRILDRFAREHREATIALARCLIQIRNLTPEVTRLLWEDLLFRAAVHARLVMHEDTFRPAEVPADGRSDGAGPGAPVKPRVVVSEWGPADGLPPKP